MEKGKELKIVGLVLALLILPRPVLLELQGNDPNRLDSREMDIKLSLVLNKANSDAVFEYNDVSFGEDTVNHTVSGPTPKPQTGADKHKTKPPKLDSTCKHEAWEQLFNNYYTMDYTNYEIRLHEHKLIENFLSKERDDAVAWGLCQYGGIRMQCGRKRRCECLSQLPPFVYIQSGQTCVGALGSECFDNPKAPIKCDKGIKCKAGYCGGAEAAYQRIAFNNANFCSSSALSTLSAIILITLVYL